MDLQKLIYLEAVYRLGSFTKASEELHISQPAITKAIKNLEHFLEVELIIRNPKSIAFTEAGEALVRWAVHIIEDFAAARQEMTEFSKSANMYLRLGISNMVGSWIYGEVYSPFVRQYPQSTIVLKEYPWADICQSVISKELDMAYTTWEQGFADPKLDLHQYLDSELFVVLPSKHELSAYRRVPFSRLDGQTLAVFAKNSLINNIITRKCEELQIHPRMINATNHFSSMLNLVDAGTALGFAVMDRKSAPFNKRKYALRPLDEPVLLETGFITRHGTAPTKAMRLFMEFVQTHLN